MTWHSPCTLRCYNSRGAQPKTIVGGSPTHGREAGWRLQRSCTPSGDREEATRGWFNPSWGAILSTVSWGSLPNLLPHLVREATLTLTRVGATDVWHLLRPNAPSLSAGHSERSRSGLAPLGNGEDRCHSLEETECILQAAGHHGPALSVPRNGHVGRTLPSGTGIMGACRGSQSASAIQAVHVSGLTLLTSALRYHENVMMCSANCDHLPDGADPKNKVQQNIKWALPKGGAQ